MDTELIRFEKAEHRLVCFLLKHGLGFDRDSIIWKKLRLDGKNRFRFEQLRTIVPKFNLDLRYFRLSTAEQPSLSAMLSCAESSRLIAEIPKFCFDHSRGLVFNHGGIRGGVVMHNFDLPSDRYSASLVWDTGESRVRLQRFAEFCLAMRSINWKTPDEEQCPVTTVPAAIAELSLSATKPLAIRIYLLLMACVQDPQILRDLQHDGFGLESAIECGVSYLVVPHSEASELFGCDESSVKRSLQELSAQRLIEHRRFGRHVGYRLTIKFNGEVK